MAQNSADKQSTEKQEKKPLPQDSAEVKPETTETHPGASMSVQNTEPEDTYLTGGQSKQQRRELEPNVKDDGNQGQRPPEQSAGIHSTGSFTGEAVRPEDPSK